MKSKRSSRRRQSRRTRKYKRKGGGKTKKYGGTIIKELKCAIFPHQDKNRIARIC